MLAVTHHIISMLESPVLNYQLNYDFASLARRGASVALAHIVMALAPDKYCHSSGSVEMQTNLLRVLKRSCNVKLARSQRRARHQSDVSLASAGTSHYAFDIGSNC